MLDVTMGGRVAEELIFGESEVTTGASSDLRQATRLAREMITKYGFSERLGLASTEYSDYGLSHETRLVIEDEVKRLLEEANQRARRLLKKHEKDLHMLAKQLLDKETLTGAELRRLVKMPAKSGDASFIEEGFGASAVGAKDVSGGKKAEKPRAPGATDRRPRRLPRLPRPRRKPPPRRQRLPRAEQPRALEPRERDATTIPRSRETRLSRRFVVIILASPSREDFLTFPRRKILPCHRPLAELATRRCNRTPGRTSQPRPRRTGRVPEVGPSSLAARVLASASR